jgi:biuret amidohydrolase
MAAFASAALLALHFQNENCHPDGKVRLGLAEADPRREALLAAAGRLFARARARGLPLLRVRLALRADGADHGRNAPLFRRQTELGAWIDGTWGAEFHDALKPLPGEFVVTHGRNSAFYASRLQEHLDQLRPARLVVAGVSTTFAVESTVRDAVDRGFEVTVARDACATGDPAMHEASLKALALLAEVAATDEILARL